MNTILVDFKKLQQVCNSYDEEMEQTCWAIANDGENCTPENCPLRVRTESTLARPKAIEGEE